MKLHFLNPASSKWTQVLLSFFASLFLLRSSSAIAQDTIFLASQDTLLVYIESVEDDYIHYSKEPDSDRRWMLDRAKISKISIQEASPYADYGEEGDTLINLNVPEKPKDTINYKSNGLFVNLVGNGASISLHYEHPLFRREALFVTGSLGAGRGADWTSGLLDINAPNIRLGSAANTPPPSSNPPPDPGVPVLLNMQTLAGYGHNSLLFIVGLGLTTAYVKDTSPEYYPYPLVGFAVRPFSKRVFFRLYLSAPLTERSPENFDWVPVGINIGKVF